MIVAITRINNFKVKPGAGNIAPEDFKRVMALMASPPPGAYYRDKEI